MPSTWTKWTAPVVGWRLTVTGCRRLELLQLSQRRRRARCLGRADRHGGKTGEATEAGEEARGTQQEKTGKTQGHGVGRVPGQMVHAA